jgi:apolipoprotein D and lipocalin family protein
MRNILLVMGLIFSMNAKAGLRKNIIDVAYEAGNFKTLLSLLNKVELTEVVRASKKITIFAPTDEAFLKLPSQTVTYLLENPEVLKNVLLYHVIPTKLKGKKVVKSYELKTLAGKTIKVSANDSKVILNDESKIVAANVKARNGIIHVIDSVLVFNEDTPANNIQTVDYVDLNKYKGTWYEIARYPNSFQTKCFGTKATYGQKGKFITVLNECQKKNGETQKGKALATVKNTDTNAELNVSFVPILKYFGFFGGDYNVLDLGDDYEYVLVGDKKRKTFWILARTKTIDENLYQELLEMAVANGYRKELIRKTPVWK